MNFLLSAKAGAAIAGLSALTVLPLQVVAQLSGSDVNDIAKGTTVLINGQNAGSGVIFDQQGDTYYVLTAKHVVATEDEYEVIAPDESTYPLSYSTVQHLPTVDLAVLQFKSRQAYEKAQLGNSDGLTEGDTVFIAGWPAAGDAIPHIYQLTTGQISGLPRRPLPGGYGLIYTNVTREGMSGGPIFDQQGEVVGIHGQAEGREVYLPTYETDATVVRAGFNLGIPVNTFLQQAEQTAMPIITQERITALAESAQPAPPPTYFARPPRLVNTRVPNNFEGRRTTYYFTIDLPAAAAESLEQVTIAQTLGSDYPRFSARNTTAFEGTYGDRGEEIPLAFVVSDRDSRTVTVTFEPPVAPGRQITLALDVRRNPDEGTYQYRVVAYPAGAAGLEQYLGLARLQFYHPASLKF
ncbi:DUF2808 domain-containing protein [Sphaerothrix gracilis]|uniref:DUF2808 domain-containing protein n=1 Tax=Sphaerothrix gracilis TaxID=3151835 RepID=UPI0031FD8465